MKESNLTRSRVLKFLIHGVLVGLPVLGFNLLGYMVSSDYFTGDRYLMNLTLSPTVVGAFSYAVLFTVTGGINLSFAESFWGIKSNQNIGAGMRDGFLLVLIISISFLPLTPLLNTLIMGSFYSPTMSEILLVIVVAMPIYSLLFGVIGEKLASFLHGDVD